MITFLAMAGLWASPVQSPALRSADALLTESGLDWASSATPVGRLHAQADSPAQDSAASLAHQADEARRDVLAMLEEAEAPAVDLFYIDSRETMERLVGARPKALSAPAAYYALFVYNSEVAAHHRHELTHVYAAHFWGAAASPAHWINEGLAQWAEGTCAGVPLDRLASALMAEGRDVPVPDLVLAFGSQPPLEANVQVGSLVGFLIREYGLARVQALWRHGVDRFPALFGTEWTAAVEQWQAELAAMPRRPLDLDAVLSSGCG